MQTIALLIVLALGAPSVGALFCDIACAAQHEDAAVAPQGTPCHDHAPPQSEAPSMSGSHVCHEVAVVPASVVRDAASNLAIAPALVRAVFDVVADHGVGRDLVAAQAWLTGHAPPPVVLPLRI